MTLDSDALKLFLAIVDGGSLSAAAETLHQTPSAVSKGLSRLETYLGITLVVRSTRRMELTEEGQAFLPKARTIMHHLADLEESVRVHNQKPSGKLRVDTSVSVMNHCVAPHIAAFRALYPAITLELTCNDRIVDLIEHRTDIAIRTGSLNDSTLHARTLRSSPRFVVASPAYLAAHGTPQKVDDLAHHEILGFTHPESLNAWPLINGAESTFVITPTLLVSSGESQRHLVLNGVGLACLSAFSVREDLTAGRLVKVLEPLYSAYQQPLHAVYYRNTKLARRIACFLDFFAERI